MILLLEYPKLQSIIFQLDQKPAEISSHQY